MLTKKEMDRVCAVLGCMTEEGQTRRYCVQHLASEAGIPSHKLSDVHNFARQLPQLDSRYEIDESGGTCDTGPHHTGELVIREKRPPLQTSGAGSRQTQAFFTFLDLEKYGVTEEALRGGPSTRLTEHPWSMSQDIRRRLRPLLQAHGFDPEKDVQVQEFVNRDGFLFSQ